jgi:preprotein translocase subunit SecD
MPSPHHRLLASLVLATALAACVRAPDPDPPMGWDHAPVSVQGRLAADEAADGLTPAEIVGTGEQVHLHPEVRFWNRHLSHVEAEASGRLVTLRLRFTEDGARRVERLTDAERGARFALLVNGHVVEAPPIARAVRVDPDVPVEVDVLLSEEDAAGLADAVARTWSEEQEP